MAEALLSPPRSPPDPLPSWAFSTLPSLWGQECELVKWAVEGAVLFLYFSGGLEPVLNGFSKEHVRKGKQ